MNRRQGMRVDRRRFVQAGCATIAASVAGCLGRQPDDKTTDDEPEPNGLETLLSGTESSRDFQYDSAHSGHADVDGPKADVDVAWTFREFETDSSYNITTPAVVDGVVYVAEGTIEDEDGKAVVSALEGATGDVIWDWTFHGTNSVAPVTVNDDRVVLVIGGQLVVLNADSGDEELRTGQDLSQRVTVDGDTAYVVKTTYRDPVTLQAIDLETGSVRWQYSLDEEVLWPSRPAVVDGTVFQGGHEITALSAADGTVQWSEPVDGTVTGAPTIVDDAVYVPSGNGEIVVFDRDDGRHRWTGEVDGGTGEAGQIDAMVSSVAVADGTVFASNSWTLTALDAATGTTQWSKETGTNDPPVVADGVVYVSGINRLAAYDVSDGERRWTFRTNARRGNGTGPVVLDGVVFYASDGLYTLTEP